MKICTMSLITREMQIKTTMRYYLPPVRMATIKQQVLVRMWRKGNTSALLVGMQTSAATVENSMEIPQKVKTVHVSFTSVPVIPSPYSPIILSLLPSGHCQPVLNFSVFGYILLACSFC